MKRIWRLAAAVTGVAMSMSACSASGGTSGGGSGDKSMTIVFISGPSTDPFFSAMSKGAQDAAGALGVKVNYVTTSGQNVGPADFAALVTTAVAQKPDGMMVSNFFPSAMDPAIKQAVTGGTPTISVNSGAASWQTNGSFAYVGQDEYQAGVAGAQQMLDNNIADALCINHVPGNPSVEARCNGFIATFKKANKKATAVSTPLNDASNPSALTQDIAAALHADPGVQGIFTLGVDVANAAQAAVTNGKSQVKVGTCDLSTPVLNAVKAGTLMFAIDQQPYMQGYEGVVAVVQKVRYGLQPVGQLSTGPLVITASNVDQVLDVNQRYHGVRGAA